VEFHPNRAELGLLHAKLHVQKVRLHVRHTKRDIKKLKLHAECSKLLVLKVKLAVRNVKLDRVPKRSLTEEAGVQSLLWACPLSKASFELQARPFRQA